MLELAQMYYLGIAMGAGLALVVSLIYRGGYGASAV